MCEMLCKETSLQALLVIIKTSHVTLKITTMYCSSKYRASTDAIALLLYTVSPKIMCTLMHKWTSSVLLHDMYSTCICKYGKPVLIPEYTSS